MREQDDTFAQFRKCALQVNPHAFGGRHHGIAAETCVDEGIEIAGFADAEMARRILQEADLVVATTEKVRCVCLATHNTSLLVVGDTGWIGVCTASGDQAEMPVHAQGSIDVQTIRSHVAGTLGGGEETSRQCDDTYGFDDS